MRIDTSELVVADTEMRTRKNGNALVKTPADSMPATSGDDEINLEGGSDREKKHRD